MVSIESNDSVPRPRKKGNIFGFVAAAVVGAAAATAGPVAYDKLRKVEVKLPERSAPEKAPVYGASVAQMKDGRLVWAKTVNGEFAHDAKGEFIPLRDYTAPRENTAAADSTGEINPQQLYDKAYEDADKPEAASDPIAGLLRGVKRFDERIAAEEEARRKAQN